MDYQLVLQFQGDSLADYDQLIAVEESLINALANSADVDGHDVGHGEANIFIVTPDPARSFRCVHAVLLDMDLLQVVTVAFREIKGNRYKVIWPEGSTQEFEVR